MTDLDRIVSIICEVGSIPEVGSDQDLQEAGFTSMCVLQLLVELEDAFSVSIPDEKFIAANTPNHIFNMIESLR